MKNYVVIAIWIISLILIIVNVIINPTSFFVNGTIILGWLLFAIQLTWNQSEKFYMTIKRCWFYMKNPECVWNMEIEYQGNFDRSTFDKLDSVFLNKGDNQRIIPISNTRKIYKLDTLSFEISLNEQNNTLHLSLQDLEVSYRRSRKIIEDELGKLLEEINNKIKADNTHYSLIINFNDFNPYYGFFIRRLSAKDIQFFNVKFNIENDKVSIGKKSMEINTTSLQKLTTFSKEYLALSPR